MDWTHVSRFVLVFLASVLVFLFPWFKRWWKAKRYFRGRNSVSKKTAVERSPGSRLRWGNTWLPESAATQHFLAVGTTGSGKSQVQRLLMREPLRGIGTRNRDSRAIIFDAKNDVSAYLRRVGVSCPVYSLNPFEGSDSFPIACAWDIAADVTSPARAQNLAASLIPSEKGGNNQYFTDAARMVVSGVVESLIMHSRGVWTFPDLVTACLSQSSLELILSRDDSGSKILAGFFGDERTAYQVFTTVYSRMSYFKPVAALWQRQGRKLSIREWLESDAILILGANATAKTSLDAINEQVFRVMVEEVDVQRNSSARRTWVWIDEARLAGPLLRGELLPFLAVKGRSKGVALVLAFQDIEGLREAAGERLANELVAQMSHKALLRMESDGSAAWASKQLGQFETIEYFSSESGSNQSLSAQRVIRDSVLPSEFFQIPPTSRDNGLTGYFLSPGSGAYRGTIQGEDIQPVVVSETEEESFHQVLRPESHQWISGWEESDRERLGLSL